MTGPYGDIKSIFDAALENGGAKVICADYGQAVYWRSRAYKFRKETQRLAAEQFSGTALSGKTPYDSLVLTLKEGERVVYIKVGHNEVTVEPLTEEDRVRLGMFPPAPED